MRFHLLANFHLDPVWLWDWREGMNEAVTTCRTVLSLMDEYPELTLIRGEAAVYEFIQQHDPLTFERIKKQVAMGRWDVVGGTYIQSDTNLPATEVLVRQLSHGVSYCKNHLGVRPRVAWCADSFGHSAGWPEIYASAGMQGFAFSRPMAADLDLPSPAFWWEGPSGVRILSWRIPIGWYGSVRGEIVPRLERYRAEAPGWRLHNIAIFFGLGNHGGGPTRADLDAILKWKHAHPEISVEFSTLHRFFGALRREATKLPVVRGELNYALRGCYASAAHFKFKYRRAESAVLRAERTSALVAAFLGTGDTAGGPADLAEAWRAVLFNSFHDILPGTCIERALADQVAWLGLAHHHAQRAELAALNRLASEIAIGSPPVALDRPAAVPVLLWNSLPVDFTGAIEVEVPLDYRPIAAFESRPDDIPIEVLDSAGAALPFQCVATEHHFFPLSPWRKRLVVRLSLPAAGWRVVTIGWKDDPKRSRSRPTDLRVKGTAIANRRWRIFAQRGADGVELRTDAWRSGRGRRRMLRILTMADPWGSWGGHDGEKEANLIDGVRCVWRVRRVEVLERGPERAALWVRLAGENSELELTFLLCRDDPTVVVRARLFWAERAARLKLEIPFGGPAEFEVPGATVERGPAGEVPGGRWVRGKGRDGAGVFASDALYNFDVQNDVFHATVVRSCRYAMNASSEPSDQPWRPYMDRGEHVFTFALAPPQTEPAGLADRLESPPVAIATYPHRGSLPPVGSLLALAAPFRLLALAPAKGGNGWMLRIQNAGKSESPAEASFLGAKLGLGRVRAGAIVTTVIVRSSRGWIATPVNSIEEAGAKARS